MVEVLSRVVASCSLEDGAGAGVCRQESLLPGFRLGAEVCSRAVLGAREQKSDQPKAAASYLYGYER